MTSYVPPFLVAFDRVVAERPLSIAIDEHGSNGVSFRDLDARATSLAASLRDQGASIGEVVALACGRSVDHIAGMLAAWRVGAAFVPIDPSMPSSRRDRILDDACVRFVLEHGRFQLRDHAPDRGRLIDAAGVPAAYVIYTSGSTGIPRGVVVGHDGLLTMLEAQIEAFEISSTSRCLWILSPSFDASISDIGTSLLAGAQLHFVNSPIHHTPSNLARLIADDRITHVDIPPSLLAVIDPNAMPSRRITFIVGGEPSPPETLQRWARRHRVINVYGPTEATVCTSLCACDPETWDRPLVGRPLPGVTYRVVDETGRDAPIGSPGELVISGPSVAWGYLDTLGQQSEKLRLEGGVRTFYTRDRVVAHAPDEIEFLGRIDRQIKLNGLRIEPGEIEAAMLSVPGITRVYALLAPRRAGDTERSATLAAVYQGTEHDVTDLRARLAARLPSWMIPHRFIARNELPTTTSGKVDAHAIEEFLRDSENEEAQQPTESRLHRALRRIVGCQNIPPDRPLVDLGLDSLGWLRLIAWAERERIPLYADDFATPRLDLASLETRVRARSIHRRERDRSNDACEALRDRLSADRDLAEMMQPRGGSCPGFESKDKSVLVTGAAGFFGAHVLDEILSQTNARVIAVVRASDASAGMARIEARLARHGRTLSRERASRVEVICGDLADRHLGLSERAWRQIARRVERVVHVAARVNLVEGCDTLWRDNVEAAREVLRLSHAGTGRLLHVSTLSVLVSSDHPRGRLLESDDLRSMTNVYGGYAQTKWAAEWMLRQAAHTLRSLIHVRTGLLTGDLLTARPSDADQLSMFLRGLANLGTIPQGYPRYRAVDLTPVDHAAARLVALNFAAPEGGEHTFHIANPVHATLGEIVDAMRDRGIEINELSPEAWRQHVEALDRRDDAHGASVADEVERAIALLSLGDRSRAAERSDALDLFLSTGFEFSFEAAEALLGAEAMRCPSASELLSRYIDATFTRSIFES